MRAAVAFLLPLLGQCRNFAGQDSLEAKRDVVIQQDAVSICYIYTTTYLQTVSIGGPTGPGGPSGEDNCTSLASRPIYNKIANYIRTPKLGHAATIFHGHRYGHG